MDIIVSFVGGPLDGTVFTSDSDDALEREKVQQMAQVIGGCLRDAEEREVKFEPGLTYSVPSQWLTEKAKQEAWSDAKVAAIVTKYDYAYSHYREAEGIAEIFMKFVGSR